VKTLLRGLCALCVLAAATPAGAHDLERTQVSIAFAPDGSFTVDVSNEPNWLKLRLERFSGSFADRVVLWVDGHEVRPTSVEFLPSSARAGSVDGLATYRMRGQMPLSARTLRWYYGLVIDPYPLTIRRADGRVIVEEIGGDAWSGTIDLSGQFRQPWLSQRSVLFALVGLLVVPLAVRSLSWSGRRRTA
jgi:hypothetical protein